MILSMPRESLLSLGFTFASCLLVIKANAQSPDQQAPVRQAATELADVKRAQELYRRGEELHSRSMSKRPDADTGGTATAKYQLIDGVAFIPDDGWLIKYGQPWNIPNRTAFRLSPNGTGSFRVDPAAYLPPDKSGQPVGDWSSTAKEVPLGFAFPFGGASYQTAWVSTNGCVSFGSPIAMQSSISTYISSWDVVSDATPRLCPELSSQPRPVFFQAGPESAIISWDLGPNGSFQAVLKATGDVYFYYADPPVDGSAVAVVTGQERWWHSNRLIARSAQGAAQATLTQLGDSNVVMFTIQAPDTTDDTQPIPLGIWLDRGTRLKSQGG